MLVFKGFSTTKLGADMFVRRNLLSYFGRIAAILGQECTRVSRHAGAIGQRKREVKRYEKPGKSSPAMSRNRHVAWASGCK